MMVLVGDIVNIFRHRQFCGKTRNGSWGLPCHRHIVEPCRTARQGLYLHGIFAPLVGVGNGIGGRLFSTYLILGFERYCQFTEAHPIEKDFDTCRTSCRDIHRQASVGVARCVCQNYFLGLSHLDGGGVKQVSSARIPTVSIHLID